MKPQPEYILAGVLMKQHLSALDTNGALSLFENHSAGPSSTPIHVHAHDDETLYMLEGQMTALLNGTEHTLMPGESIFLPRRIPHQLMNVSGTPTHYILLCTPGGFEDFLAEGGHRREPGEAVHPPSPGEIERFKAAAPKYGITLLPNW